MASSSREISLFKGVQFQRFSTTAPAGTTSIEGGSGMVDDVAISKIVEGVVAGIVQGIK